MKKAENDEYTVAKWLWLVATLVLRKPRDQIMKGAQQCLDSEQNDTQDTVEAKPAKIFETHKSIKRGLGMAEVGKREQLLN